MQMHNNLKKFINNTSDEINKFANKYLKKKQETITGETTDIIRNLIKKIINPLKRGVTVQMPNNLKKIISILMMKLINLLSNIEKTGNNNS